MVGQNDLKASRIGRSVPRVFQQALNGLEDERTACAAAEVAVEGVFNAFLRWSWIVLQQRVHAHDEAGCTEAALGAMRVRQALLHRMQARPRAADTLDRRYDAAGHRAKGSDARVDGPMHDLR